LNESISMFEITLKTYKIKKPIRLIELFGGIGSQAMALRNIGADFEHYRLIEWDKYAVASYNAIHGTNFTTTDIKKVKGDDLGIIDTSKYEYIVTYSFPCQDLSLAGKRKGMAKGENTRSGLLWEVERILKECKELPQILLMENVPEVVGKKNIQDFRQWQYFLEGLGYSNHLKLLNAKNYGVAQNRNRAFMVSILGKWHYKFPEPVKLTKTIADYLEDEVDEKFYLKNEKADKLIEQLIELGQLEGIQYADGTINEPKTREVANCITTRISASGITNRKQESNAIAVLGGIYTDASENFQRGIMPDVSKTLKANAHDAGIVQVGNIVSTGNWDNPQRGRIYSCEGVYTFT